VDGEAAADSMTCMAAPRALLLLALATGNVACTSSQAAAARRPLPPPAGDGRAGVRDDRGAGPALASGLKPDVRAAVDTAQSLVGRRDVVVDGRDYGAGCTALVAGALLDVARGRNAMRTGIRCSPGDVVFLADRPGGTAAHVGLVTGVEPDGTAVVVHRLARGVAKMRVNLGYPGRVSDPATGKRLNDTLQVGKSTAPAGSLVVGVATLL
jgi:hypothetical protein